MLARLARLVAAALLLAGWQAALDHSVDHAVGAHVLSHGPPATGWFHAYNPKETT